MATDEVKLRALLPHWMEHNDEHAAEFRLWADKARAAGHEKVAEEIDTAAEQLGQVNEALREALNNLGEPA